MIEEQKDDIVVDPSTTEQSEIDDSQTSEEQTENAEPTDDKQGTQEEQPQPVPVDRFNEMVHGKNEQIELLKQQLAVQQQPQQPQETAPDLMTKYGAQDANTREFLRDVTAQMQVEANKVAVRAAEPLARQNEALARELAGVREKLFRQENTDVVRGSKEESEIAQYVQMGMPLDKATKAVMYDKRVGEAKKVGQTKVANKAKVKAQANMETQSIPANSGVPQGQQKSFKDQLRDNMGKSGL